MPSNIQCPSNPSKFHIFRHTECHDNIILINQVNKSQSLISMLLKVVCSSHVGYFMFNCISYFYLKSKITHLFRNKIRIYETPCFKQFYFLRIKTNDIISDDNDARMH